MWKKWKLRTGCSSKMHTQCPATAISSRRRTRPARDQGSGAGPSVSAQLTAERKPRADRQVGRTCVCSQAFSSTEPHSSEPLSRLVVLSPVPFVPTYLLHFFFPLIILQPPLLFYCPFYTRTQINAVNSHPQNWFGKKDFWAQTVKCAANKRTQHSSLRGQRTLGPVRSRNSPSPF